MIWGIFAYFLARWSWRKAKKTNRKLDKLFLYPIVIVCVLCILGGVFNALIAIFVLGSGSLGNVALGIPPSLPRAGTNQTTAKPIPTPNYAVTNAHETIIAANSLVPLTAPSRVPLANSPKIDCLTADEARRHIGESNCVFGFVNRTYSTDTAFFVEFSSNVRFFVTSLKYNWAGLAKECVKVTGKIQEYNNRPYIDIGESELLNCNNQERASAATPQPVAAQPNATRAPSQPDDSIQATQEAIDANNRMTDIIVDELEDMIDKIEHPTNR